MRRIDTLLSTTVSLLESILIPPAMPRALRSVRRRPDVRHRRPGPGTPPPGTRHPSSGTRHAPSAARHRSPDRRTPLPHAPPLPFRVHCSPRSLRVRVRVKRAPAKDASARVLSEGGESAGVKPVVLPRPPGFRLLRLFRTIALTEILAHRPSQSDWPMNARDCERVIPTECDSGELPEMSRSDSSAGVM